MITKFLSPTLLALIALLMTSCVSRKEMVYFNDLERQAELSGTNAAGLEIKPNDLLTINVSAPQPEAAIPFNLTVAGPAQGGADGALRITAQPQLQPYLVDSDGNIEFPILGTVQVAGMNRQELAAKLRQEISDYIQNPIVNIRIVNFQVSVLGEVNRPGTFDVRDEYLSLPKALGLAGDLSIYGRRDNVLVMREENGSKSHAYLDLTKAETAQSPYYYLQQNDVVYIEPNGPQRQSASYNRNASVYISIASVLVSLIVLIAR